jgi:hypothetical protein
MKPFRLSRRTLLRGAGISVALPTLDAMIDGRGRWLGLASAASAAPVRVMAFHFPHGVVLPQWTPAAQGKGYTITPGLMPLAAFKDDFNVITGLQQNAAGKGVGGGHAQGMPCFATATVDTGAGAGGPSFDQVLATELGAATKFRSLVANNEQAGSAAEQATTAHMNNIAWTAAATPAPAERDVAALFGKLVSAPGAVIPSPDAKVALARKKSVLDAVMTQIDELRKKVGSTDRGRLEEHLTGLRDAERILTNAANGGPAAACTTDAPGAGATLSVVDRAKLFLRLFAMAFRCDLTRYASFAMCNGYDSRTYPELSSIDNHHQITHNGGKYGNGADIEMKFVTYFAGIFAYFLEQLKSSPEAGGTLLDNCLIYYGSEMAEGDHSWGSMPVVLAGKAGGQVVTGRHLVYPGGTPMAKLFLAILKLGGSKNATTFGVGGSAPLDGLTT